MRAPLSWLREHADLPEGTTGRDLAERLVRAGLEVETVESPGAEISGPLVVGRVASFEQETHSNGKTVRWCQVDVGEAQPRGIVCGAHNFAVGDAVVVALPGAVLPGEFEITARTTYGHTSDGMICSSRELGVGDDHSGILVLPGETEVGADAVELLDLRDEVLDIAVTPDRAYCLSIRGLAREAATAYGVAFHDPAVVAALTGTGEPGHPGEIADPTGADRFVLRTVTGLDPEAVTPLWMQRRLVLSGMRPVSLAVDVTNYVMLEMGQPLHAFDRNKLKGAVVVRRATAGERLDTLDHVTRDLDPEDLLITDDRGPIGLAGTMGGLETEIGDGSTELVIEAAHFLPVPIARMQRRHKLPSEAAKRFERGVDPALPPAASARAVALLRDLGGATYVGSSDVDLPRPTPVIALDPARPGRTAGVAISEQTTRAHLGQIGATVVDGPDGTLAVSPPSWRPDLLDPADLDEEVIRLVGYDTIPSVLPAAPAGRGFTEGQRLRRRVGQALARAGYVEAPSYPFVGEHDLDNLMLPADDGRRQALRLANPLSDEEPLLRTTLLPGLLHAVRRNVGRGTSDVGLFELALVFRPGPEPLPPAPRPPLERRPTDEEVAALDAALPAQPAHVAVVLTGDREPTGWWGPGRPASWADAVEAARVVAREARVELGVRADQHAPWHPGRCAALLAGDRVVGHAGELHPRVVEAFGLPERTAAMELDLDLLGFSADPVPAPRISTYPVATQDVALVVDDTVAQAEVADALRAGAGPLLESMRLFDVYRGAQLGAGKASLAYALRFRAPDRTLTAEEVTAAREAAVGEAHRRTGAVPRG
ncbi:MAG: phenylalanyl-tRNA synthetase beta chain [Actinomycetota bacterium]|jgi:phenylalanyl-tRNA synthetase beta chain|nr:phenylalanyl-tRNA synthetase beta chain [Actinomycetota bacterium]